MTWTAETLAAKGYALEGNRAVPAPPKRRGRRSISEQWADKEDKRREAELQAEVTAWLAGELAAGHILCWTHVARPQRDRPGLPDLIVGLRADLVVAIELKRPDGTGALRPEQAVWLRAWGSNGAVCLSLAQVVERVRAWRMG